MKETLVFKNRRRRPAQIKTIRVQIDNGVTLYFYMLKGRLSHINDVNPAGYDHRRKDSKSQTYINFCTNTGKALSINEYYNRYSSTRCSTSRSYCLDRNQNAVLASNAVRWNLPHTSVIYDSVADFCELWPHSSSGPITGECARFHVLYCAAGLHL